MLANSAIASLESIMVFKMIFELSKRQRNHAFDELARERRKWSENQRADQSPWIGSEIKSADSNESSARGKISKGRVPIRQTGRSSGANALADFAHATIKRGN
jgi:hypothetical protein